MKWVLGGLLLANLLVLGWGLSRPAPDLKKVDHEAATLLLLAETHPASVAAELPVREGKKSRQMLMPRTRPPATSTLQPKSRKRVVTVLAPRVGMPAESRGLRFTDTACRTLGPFRTKDLAEQVAEQLASIQVAASLRRITTTDLGGFWVLMSALPDQRQAREILAKLNRAGFENAWLFRDGDLVNAISLGLYSREENARRRAQQVRAAGFDAWVKPQQQQYERYWLDYRLEPGRHLPPRALALARRTAMGVREYPRHCPGDG